MKKLVYAVMIFLGTFLISCVDEDGLDSNSDMSANEIMNNLDIKNPLIWNSMSTQHINIEEGVENNTKSAQAAIEYPSGNKYYFTLFEDVPSLKADYDFNDIMIRSKLYLETDGDKQTGRIVSRLWNSGGVIPSKIGLMFYEVNGNSYKNIPYSEIKVNGIQLNEEPWMFDVDKDTDDWTVSFEFNKKSNIWINYFVYSKHKDVDEVWDVEYEYVMQGGFASPNSSEFEMPDRSFLSPTNLCWGMEIEAEDISIPNENELFLNCFPDFQEWAESGGEKKTTWYENPDSKFTTIKESDQ